MKYARFATAVAFEIPQASNGIAYWPECLRERERVEGSSLPVVTAPVAILPLVTAFEASLPEVTARFWIAFVSTESAGTTRPDGSVTVAPEKSWLPVYDWPLVLLVFVEKLA